MTLWQLSLRTILFVLMPAVAVIAVAVRNAEPRLVRTGNPFHLAIAGDGFFCVQDQLDGRSRYTRGGEFMVNNGDQICLRIGGEEFPLVPNIIIPNDRRQIQVDANGYVSVLSEDLYVQQGQLELATFSAMNLPVFSESMFEPNDETGPPTVQVPGEGAPGEIKQRHLEQRALIWHRESIVTLLIGFALGALATMSMYHRVPPRNASTATISKSP
jgi:flagellar basal body rod protein FlgG